MASEPLVIKFDDFKKLIGNKRLYYFIGEDFYDFLFFTEGVIIKTSLFKTEVPDEKRFFSDPMFYSSIQIKFQIKNPEPNVFDIDGIRKSLVEPIYIEDIQGEEVKNVDIQREGVLNIEEVE